MGARELAEVAPGAAYNTKHFAVEGDFEDSARKSEFSDEEYLVRAGRDADGIGSAAHLRQALACGSVSIY